MDLFRLAHAIGRRACPAIARVRPTLAGAALAAVSALSAPDPALGFERRWVIYNGMAEASMTPPGWNGWLHHTVDVPPTEEDYKAHPWELQHIGNPTGTPGAIRPDGSTLRPGPRQPTGGDYEAWSPGP